MTCDSFGGGLKVIPMWLRVSVEDLPSLKGIVVVPSWVCLFVEGALFGAVLKGHQKESEAMLGGPNPKNRYVQAMNFNREPPQKRLVKSFSPCRGVLEVCRLCTACSTAFLWGDLYLPNPSP